MRNPVVGSSQHTSLGSHSGVDQLTGASACVCDVVCMCVGHK